MDDEEKKGFKEGLSGQKGAAERRKEID